MKVRNRKVLPWLLLVLALQSCDSPDNGRRVVGYLESQRVEINAVNSEPITRIAVAEGQAVTKGQLLLQQDTARIDAQIAAARALVAETQARLDERIRGPRKEQIAAGRASLKAAEHDLAFATTEYDRAESVFAKHLTSRESVDRAKNAVDVAAAEAELQRARLQELLVGTTVEELEQAESTLHQAEASLSLLQVDRGRQSALAPAAGIIDSRLFEPGERPAPGQPMMILLTGDQPYARVYVPEALRVSVVPGTRALIFVDGLPEPLNGRVRWVARDAAFTPYFALTERDRGRLTYAAKVDIVRTGRRLPDGVPVEVRFLPGPAGD